MEASCLIQPYALKQLVFGRNMDLARGCKGAKDLGVSTFVLAEGAKDRIV